MNYEIVEFFRKSCCNLAKIGVQCISIKILFMRWNMAASYKKLFKLLIDREMKSKELAAKAGISPATLAKMKKDEATVRSSVRSMPCPKRRHPMKRTPCLIPSALAGCWTPPTTDVATPTRRRTLSSIISLQRRAHGASTPTPRTTTWQVRSRHAPRGAVLRVRDLRKRRKRRSHIREHVSVCDTEKGMGSEQEIWFISEWKMKYIEYGDDCHDNRSSRLPPQLYRKCFRIYHQNQHVWSNVWSWRKNRHILPDKKGRMCL